MSNYRKNLTGMRVGQLMVIRLAEGDEKRYGRRSWICKCDCGNECVVLTSDLINNKRKHCKDISQHHWKKMDLTGKKFGHLYVLSEAPNNERVYNMRSWLCKCDCGNEKIIPTAFLTSRRIQTCGHKCVYSHKWRI